MQTPKHSRGMHRSVELQCANPASRQGCIPTGCKGATLLHFLPSDIPYRNKIAIFKQFLIMKKLFLIYLIIMFSANLFAQEEEYPSKESNEYYENYWSNFVFFTPLDTAFILGFQSEYYEIRESEQNYEPFSRFQYQTPYADSIWSLFYSLYDSLFNSLDFDEMIDFDNVVIDFDFETIGDIDKIQILKYEKNDSIEAFIYTSSEYEDRALGIWIGYSENNGKDWNYYYTGITQGQPVYVKYYSQRPLIKEKGILEIDACLLRQFSGLFFPEYECIRDGIYVAFDINVISKDSDGDGLTDIVEDKFRTDKYNKDTNGNGIPDNLDTNPRVNYPRTAKSIVYEAILRNEIGNKKGDWSTGRLVLKRNNTSHYVTDSTITVLIVIDDKDLMGIRPQNHRVIFMTTDEYKNNTNHYNSGLNTLHLTPFFKVDNKKNTYKVYYSFYVGKHYLVRKTIIGWRIRILAELEST